MNLLDHVESAISWYMVLSARSRVFSLKTSSTFRVTSLDSCDVIVIMADDANSAVYDKVKEYYGRIIKSSNDLSTNACTFDKSFVTAPIKEATALIHPEILQKDYGCGAVIPEAVEGCSVLDLGSGTGLDCFVLSRLVGENGYVLGVDMTKEQLDVARKYIDYHMEKFEYRQPNINFKEGYIECLDKAGIESEAFDFIVSNCVVNLSSDKGAVLREAYRVLKPGGQMYFSDIYTNQEVPQFLQGNSVLWGECLSGALQWRELIKLATSIGFAPPILVKSVTFSTTETSEVAKLLAKVNSPDLKFCSATYRLVKISGDTQAVQDFLVDVEYKGGVKGHEKSVKFSYHGELLANTKVPMPRSTAALISQLPLDVRIIGPSDSPNSPYPPLSGYLTLDPFVAAEASIPLATPTALSSGSCCKPKSCCS